LPPRHKLGSIPAASGDSKATETPGRPLGTLATRAAAGSWPVVGTTRPASIGPVAPCSSPSLHCGSERSLASAAIPLFRRGTPKHPFRSTRSDLALTLDVAIRTLPLAELHKAPSRIRPHFHSPDGCALINAARECCTRIRACVKRQPSMKQECRRECAGRATWHSRRSLGSAPYRTPVVPPNNPQESKPVCAYSEPHHPKRASRFKHQAVLSDVRHEVEQYVRTYGRL
jgi:hypothetical protein